LFDRIEQFGLRITRIISIAGLTALMFLAVMTLADGLLRWLANAPIDGVRDMGGLAVAIGVAACLPVGLMERSNITLHFLNSVGAPAIGRVLDAFAALVTGVVYIALAWQFTTFAGKMAQAHETTWVLKIPVAPFWYVVAAILWLSVCVQAIVIILEIYHIGTPRKDSHTDSSEAVL
jgi:TRAP-type C4-dicarboxylate transport system permease small subunit